VVGGELGGTLRDAIAHADVFIGVSKAGALTPDLVSLMNEKPIIFALANPVPEIMPDLALKAGAAVVATGRSDFPNQINNVLAYPGVFRGALDARLPQITDTMKIAAAEALASLVETPTAEMIMPDVFDPRVVPAVATAVSRA
jgi:malate dehydrogenase (oxaloacetate-decarboxylating)